MDLEKQKHAPICDALERFKKKRVVPFDVPGHKRGRGNPELVELLGEKCVSLDVNSRCNFSQINAIFSKFKDSTFCDIHNWLANFIGIFTRESDLFYGINEFIRFSFLVNDQFSVFCRTF